MKFNMFEGARRISIAIAALAAAGVLALAANSDPDAAVYYVVRSPGEQPRPAVGCGADDAEVTRYERDASGNRVAFKVCFQARVTSTGAMLIPVEISGDGGWSGNDRYSAAVVGYTEAAARQIALPPDWEKQASTAYKKARLASWQEIAFNTAIGLTGFWLFTIIVGWILRGFLGIPRGMDHRPSAPSDKA